MGRTEESQHPGAVLKRAQKLAAQQAAWAKLTPEQIAEAEAAEERRQAEKRAREFERIEGLRQAAKARRLDLATAQAQAERAAELERLTRPSEDEIRELLTYTEAELAAWVARKVYQLSKLALAGERPDFKAALAAILAIEDIVRRYRQATQGKSELWLTGIVREAEIVDDESGSGLAVARGGVGARVEPGNDVVGEPEKEGVADDQNPIDSSDTGVLRVAAREVPEEPGAPEASLPPSGQDQGGAAPAGDSARSGIPALAVADAEDDVHMDRITGRDDTGDVQLSPANDSFDWTSAIAAASSSLTEACPACCQLGGLVSGQVIGGEQWLDCTRCGRTAVKRG